MKGNAVFWRKLKGLLKCQSPESAVPTEQMRALLDNPVAFGLLYFNAFLTLLGTRRSELLILAIATFSFSLSFVSVLAVFFESVRKWSKTILYVFLPATFVFLCFSLILGWLQALIEAMEVFPWIFTYLVLYGGFIWVMVLILVEAGQLLGRRGYLLACVLTFIASISTLVYQHNRIGAAVLFAWAIVYGLVTVSRKKLKGTVF